MAKQLNVINLAFTADTKAAQMQLKQLQSQLDQIISGKNVDTSLGLTAEIQKGISAAAELKVKLNDAINVNTGKLDLTKFSNSLDRSGKQLQDYAKDLEQLGPQGTEAFLSVARAISNAETPLISLNARASEFLTTLKNTARWQISSSVLHGFMGAIQHAYGYAQDLNQSLNNIRIVTGKNADEMARFAKEANAAARELSATTLDYTDASLIYYQQGLDDEAVKARTDVTVKLANVSRQSAEEVSDQMTAIWNNFAKGSENLEYYADVITALGAATASSSEEIATGLEKFAAVSKTVGLSYEYATAALATITATTRQSADTVGTGLRTLFARLEGLKLGETLEDGVDYNKYSKALESIGVQILDVNGEIKDMDTILNETAAGWDNLNQAQKIAFAQTVGGVRQYTNLIALMNNWDFMQSNLGIAKNATGTLQEQADIYAESWEAARDRVSAAAEAIYDSLLNDKFFITFLNGIEKILDGVNKLINGFGGLKGVLAGLSTVLIRVFNTQISQGISNAIQGVRNLTPQGQAAIKQKKLDAWNIAQNMSLDSANMEEGSARYEALRGEAALQKQLIANSEGLTEETRKRYQLQIDIYRSIQDSIIAKAQELDKIKEENEALEDQVRMRLKLNAGGYDENGKTNATGKNIDNAFNLFKQTNADIGQKRYKIDSSNNLISGLTNQLKDAGNIGVKSFINNLKTLQTTTESLDKRIPTENIDKLVNQLNEFKGSPETPLETVLKDLGLTANNTEKELNELIDPLRIVSDELHDDKVSAFQKLSNKLEDNGVQLSDEDKKFLLQDQTEHIKIGQKTAEKETMQEGARQVRESADEIIKQKPKIDELATSFTSLAMTITSCTTFISALSTGIDTLTNESASFGDKVSAVIGIITSGLFMTNSLIQLENTALGASAVAWAKETLAKHLNTTATTANAAAWMAHPVMWIAGIILGVAAVILAVNKHIEKNRQLNKEAAEASQQKVDALKAEREELDNLINAYKDAFDIWDKTGQSKDELDEAARKVAEACKIENAELLILQGNYKELTRLIKEYSDAKLNELITDTETNRGRAEQVFIDEMRKGTGHFAFGKYSGSIIGNSANEKGNEYLSNALTSIDSSVLSTSYGEHGINGLTFSAKQTSEDLIQVYDDLVAVRDSALEAARAAGEEQILQNNSWYKELNKYISENKEAYDLYIAAIEDHNLATVQKEVQDNFSNVSDLDSYQKAVEKIKQTYNDNEESLKSLNRVLESNYKEYYRLDNLLEDASAQSSGIDKKELGDFYNNLSKEEQSIFFSIDFRNADSLEALDKQLNLLQTHAEQNKIQTQLEVVNDALDNIIGSTDSEKWQNLADTIDWQSLGITFEDFLQQTSVRQKEILSQYTLDLYQQQADLHQQELDNLNEIEEERQQALEDFAEANQLALSANFDNNGSYLGSESNFERLQNYGAQYNINESDYETEQAYVEAILSKYKELEEQLINTQNAKESLHNAELIDAYTQEQKEIAILADQYDLNAEEIETLTDYYKDFAKEADRVDDSLQDNQKTALKVASANVRMNKGLSDLGDKWEDYNEILKDNNKDSGEYQETLKALRKNINDVLNIDNDSLSQAFFESAENLDLMRRAAEGDIEAIEELRAAAATDIIQQVTARLEDTILIEQLNELNNYLIDYAENNNLEIGASLDNTDFINACNQMIEASGMTAQEVGDYFKALGYDANINTVEKETWSQVPQVSYTATGSLIDEDNPLQLIPHTEMVSVGPTMTEVPVVEAITYTGKAGGTINYSNTKAGRSGGKKGGGGGSKEKEKKTKSEDELERYHYIKATIEDLESAYAKASKEKDRLFGNNRIKAISAEIKAIDKLIDAQDQYINEIIDYRDNHAFEDGTIGDINRMQKYVQDYTGLTANTDALGNILNYDEIMRVALQKFNEDLSDDADDKYEEFKKFIQQYEDTINLLEDQIERKEDLLRERQDKYFEDLNYKLELRVNINEHDLQRIENSIKLLGDSVYKATERLQYLWNNTGLVKDKFDNLNDSTNIQISQFHRLDAAYANGRISEDQYMEGIEGVRDALQRNLETLIDYDDQMRTYYSTTLKNASSELSFWTKQLEHSSTVLEHYQKIIALSGNEENYEMLGAVLKGQVKTRKNSYETSAHWLEELKEQRAKVQQELMQAQKEAEANWDGRAETRDKAFEQVQWLQDKLQGIVETTAEAEEQMLSDFESYLEAVNADLENDLNKINHNAEMLASNGLGFDYINSDLDKLKTIQDEYYTKTNQVYETTKFLRQIQADMDKTDNAASKEKLKNFSKMVEGLKEQGQLSKVELEIAKRRYEVELAQMALEDAKNAKSIVRLSRDSEGNYGYVYSADPDKANDAEQALADKQNDLYNYALETYNNNQQKLQELYKSQQEELNQLAEDYYKKGLMTEDEYNKKVLETKQRYHDEALIYLQNIDETRNVLNEVALTDYTEAYASYYDKITTTIDQWDEHTQQNFDDVDDRYRTWKDLVGNEVRPVVGETLSEVKQKTNAVTRESNKLTNTINDEVIPALSNEVDSINDVTAEYANQRDTILELIDALQEYLSLLDAKYEAAATKASFDENIDYSALQQEAAKRGLITSTDSSLYKTSSNSRDAKVDWLLEGSAEAAAYLSKYNIDVHDKTAIENFYKSKGDEATRQFAQDLANGKYNNVETQYGKLDKDQLIDLLINGSFASGGYTGDWGGNDGRLALLHQKELVLNESDTQNILNAVDVIRQVASMIDLQAVSAAAGLGYLTTPTIGSTASELDQNVHIEANFPSVTDHNEIEQALTTLVNRAAQFANRK